MASTSSSFTNQLPIDLLTRLQNAAAQKRPVRIVHGGVTSSCGFTARLMRVVVDPNQEGRLDLQFDNDVWLNASEQGILEGKPILRILPD